MGHPYKIVTNLVQLAAISEACVIVPPKTSRVGAYVVACPVLQLQTQFRHKFDKRYF